MKSEDDAPAFADIVSELHKAGITQARHPTCADVANIMAAEAKEKPEDIYCEYADRRGVGVWRFGKDFICKCVGITKEYLETISTEDRNRIDESMLALTKDVFKPRQEKISVSYSEKKYLERLGTNENMPWSSYVVKSALMMADLSVYLSDSSCEALSVADVGNLAVLGKELQDAFTPDEVTQAMDTVGLSPSQAVKLMAELERMRDARKNPDVDSFSLPE